MNMKTNTSIAKRNRCMITGSFIVSFIFCLLPVHSESANLVGFRQHTATNGLIEIYPQSEFQGTPVVFSNVGVYDSSTPEFNALSASLTNSSLRVKSGYRVRLYKDSSNPDFNIVKPEDDSDFSDDPLTTIISLKVEEASLSRIRPRVFLCLHGSTTLTNSVIDNQWAYVREHADGIWFNAAGLSWPSISNLVSKMNNKRVVNELNSQVKDLGVWPALTNTHPNKLLAMAPDIGMTYEATCVYKGYANTDALLTWNTNEIEYARSIYSAVPAGITNAMAYPKIYTGWQAFPFMVDRYEGKLLLVDDGHDAESEFIEGDGAFVELGPAHMERLPDFRYAISNVTSLCHAGGKPFLWFRAHYKKGISPAAEDPEFMQSVKNAYYIMEADGLIQTNDAYFIVNYDGELVCIPETDQSGNPASTMTGVMYWLLHQGINPLVGIDFAGACGSNCGNIAKTNSQIQNLDSAVTCYDAVNSIGVYGGTVGTAPWIYTNVVWNFNSDGNSEGWTDFNDRMDDSVSDGALNYTINAQADPQWRQSTGLSLLDTSQNITFEVVVKRTAGTARALSEFYVGAAKIGSIQMADNNDWQTLSFQYTGGTSSGSVASLRFDPSGGQNGSWQIDSISASQKSVYCSDLYTSRVFGSPSRIDLNLGLASSGKRYEVTEVAVDVSQNGGTPVTFSLGCIAGGITNFSSNVTVSANSTGIYAINVKDLNLWANDASTSWDKTKGLRLVFWETNGTNTDSLCIDQIMIGGNSY
jgi:hypothetical protein